MSVFNRDGYYASIERAQSRYYDGPPKGALFSISPIHPDKTNLIPFCNVWRRQRSRYTNPHGASGGILEFAPDPILFET